jgi:acetylornithine deacetylase/succinyl-diaminopimelate desuccinylase-like protein
MLRTSVVPTMFKAGVGANVIPSEAEATLDIRALPRRGHHEVLRGDGEDHQFKTIAPAI